MTFFKLTKEIRSKEGVLHFKRWSIISCKWFNVYLHAIHKHDEDTHLHNHPWNFFVICLFGSYLERLEQSVKVVGTGTMRYRNHSKFHKIDTLYTDAVYTLVITGKKQPVEWGYLVDGKNIDHVTYRQLKRENSL